MGLLVHFVADFGGQERRVGDLAFTEVERKLLLIPGVRHVTRTAVETFNTLEAAFVAAQIGLDADADEGCRELVFVNVNDRSHTSRSIPDGQGHPCFLGELTNHVRILGPGLGIFAVAQHLGILAKLDQVNTAPFTSGSPGQFRSRDVYPKTLAALIKERLEVSGANVALIPTVNQRVGYIDPFGNIKTTIQRKDLAGGTFARFMIGETPGFMPISAGMFDREPGKLHMHPGSSGPKENRFVEISARHDSAAARFPDAASGVPIENLEVFGSTSAHATAHPDTASTLASAAVEQ